jgi:hypothetical protein
MGQRRVKRQCQFEKLIRWGGVAAIMGGITQVSVLAWAPICNINKIDSGFCMAGRVSNLGGTILILLGLIAIYAIQSQASGRFGLLAFLAIFIGMALMVAILWVAAFVEPFIREQAPELAKGNKPEYLQRAFMYSTMTGLIGIVLLGISILRAGVYSRWPGLLLVLAPLLKFVMPSNIFPMLIGQTLFGIAMIWLGYTVWSGDKAR